MSIVGTSASNDAIDSSHVIVDSGAAASIYQGAFTVMMLMKTNSDSRGVFGGWADTFGGTDNGGLLIAANKLFGKSDFSSGFGSGLDDGNWRWYGYGKDAGAAHYVMHLGLYSDLSWSQGESAGAANHSDAAASEVFSLGHYVYGMGNASGHIAAAAVWSSNLSQAAVRAACTKSANDLLMIPPAAGWLFPEATATDPVTDFMGGGANEISRISIAASTDPPAFDFSQPGFGDSGAAHRFFFAL